MKFTFPLITSYSSEDMSGLLSVTACGQSNNQTFTCDCYMVDCHEHYPTYSGGNKCK
jgi:hypothetical protein